MNIEMFKQKCLDDNIPIMRDDTISYILNVIKENNVKSILEIGSAVGYSAIRMSIDNDVKITTIEKDSSRFLCAKENIKSFSLENKITIINADALEVEVDALYDLIIIDAAKSKNIEFFEKYENNLIENGLIIIDNIDFHGLTGNISEVKTRRLRSLIRKIEKFISYIQEREDFCSERLSLGDGIIVCRKKEQDEK